MLVVGLNSVSRGGRSYKTRKWQLLEAGQGREMASPLEPPEEMHDCQHPNFGPGDLFCTSDFQNSKIINLNWFKPLSFW
jgi:hypothetical protein